MKAKNLLLLLVAGLVCVCPLVVRGDARLRSRPRCKIPEPGVPQIMTMEGKFVRAAYNNEGYVILGYQVVNRSVGEEWMLLEVGMTVLDGTPAYKLTRDALSLETPDGKTIPLPTIGEHREGDTTRPAEAGEGPTRLDQLLSAECEPGVRARVLPRLDLSRDAGGRGRTQHARACLGRLYFKVPGGIKYGQHWLNVKFEKSLMRVPFRILTEEEEKMLSKNYKASGSRSRTRSSRRRRSEVTR